MIRAQCPLVHVRARARVEPSWARLQHLPDESQGWGSRVGRGHGELGCSTLGFT